MGSHCENLPYQTSTSIGVCHLKPSQDFLLNSKNVPLSSSPLENLSLWEANQKMMQKNTCTTLKEDVCLHQKVQKEICEFCNIELTEEALRAINSDDNSAHCQRENAVLFLTDVCANAHIPKIIFELTCRLYRRTKRHTSYSNVELILVCLYKTLHNENCDYTMREIQAISGVSDKKLIKILNKVFPKTLPPNPRSFAERACGYLGISRRHGFLIGLECEDIDSDEHPAIITAKMIVKYFPKLDKKEIAVVCGISYDYFKTKVNPKKK